MIVSAILIISVEPILSEKLLTGGGNLELDPP
jgi:hypothetical protein